MTPLEVIRRYYDGCSTGDVDAMTATLADDVVHYFLAPNPGSAPVRGAEHLARYWRKVAAMIEARWVVDHCLAGGREAVIEWTMFWRPQPGISQPGISQPGISQPGISQAGTSQARTSRVATRGAEWFAFAADGRIAEIRSYYQQRPDSTGLDGFPYADRGYSTTGAEHSGLHEPPG